MKAPKDPLPARPQRTLVTHPEALAPQQGPFADKVAQILAGLGENPGREGLLKTPERVEASLRFLTQGYWQTVEDVIGDAVFEETHQNMIMVRDIELYSLCEHHLLPFFGRAHVAYIPNGTIVGPLQAAADRGCLRPAASGAGAADRADRRRHRWTCSQPPGVGVVIEASHLCMMMRGVEKQNSRTITSALRGIFRDDSKTRDEFLRLAYGGRLSE